MTGKVTKTRIILSFFSLPKTLRNRNKFDTNNDNNDNNMADTKHGLRVMFCSDISLMTIIMTRHLFWLNTTN